MKKQNPQDERVVMQRRKINSEANGILMMALLVSIIVQQFILKAPFEQYAVELVCFFGMSVYMIIRNMTLGLNLFGEGKRAKGIILLNSITTGIVVTTINGVLNYAQYAQKYQEDGIGYFFAMLGISLISATAIVFALLVCIDYLNKQRQAKIQKQLDDDEEKEE